MGVQREEKTEQDKEKTARDKEVRETSRQMDSGVMPGLEATTRGDFARGATADQSFARTLPRLTQHMKDQGVDDAIAEDVAKDILKKVMDKVGGKVQAAGIAGGIGRQQAGQRVANEAILKLEQQQMNQDKAHLRTLAIGMHGTQIGDEAAARLRQINAMQNNIIHVQTRQRRAVRHSQIKPK